MDFLESKSWIVSLMGHGVVFLVVSNVFSFHSKINLPPPQSNVVWTSIQSPKKTPDHKLPPPKVLPKVEAPKEEPKKIAKPDAKPTVEKKEVKKEEAKKTMSREELLKKALANLDQNEDRPMPKANNFSSQDQPEDQLSSSEIGLLQSTSEFLEYRRLVEKTITSNFIWIRQAPDKKPVIQFFILPNGEISEPKLLSSSNDESYDQAAIRAVKKSSPIQAPPVSLNQMFKQEPFQLDFDRSAS
ncbi:MAG: TonB C-terminal domain-containing protein [Bdellovibrionota bacterium]